MSAPEHDVAGIEADRCARRERRRPRRRPSASSPSTPSRAQRFDRLLGLGKRGIGEREEPRERRGRARRAPSRRTLRSTRRVATARTRRPRAPAPGNPAPATARASAGVARAHRADRVGRALGDEQPVAAALRHDRQATPLEVERHLVELGPSRAVVVRRSSGEDGGVERTANAGLEAAVDAGERKRPGARPPVGRRRSPRRSSRRA